MIKDIAWCRHCMAVMSYALSTDGDVPVCLCCDLDPGCLHDTNEG